MIKAVIFDFDGVLVDSNEKWFDAFSTAARASGIKTTGDHETMKKNCGKRLSDFFASVSPGMHEDAKKIEQMRLMMTSLARDDEFTSSMKTFRGIKKLLRHLKKRFKLAVGSGNNRKILNRFIEKFGLRKYFDVVVSADDVHKGKPEPDMLLKVTKKLGVSPGEAVYVGDSEVDIIAAKKANMKSIAVLTGALDRERATELNADFIIEDAARVKDVVACM